MRKELDAADADFFSSIFGAFFPAIDRLLLLPLLCIDDHLYPMMAFFYRFRLNLSNL